MKLRISTWRITWRFLIVYFVIASIVFLTTFGVFFYMDENTGAWIPYEMGVTQFLIIGVLLAVFFATYIPSLLFYYYIIEDKYFVMKRYGKEFQFEYKNIEFIDIEQSKKKGMIIFYSSKAKMRYMLGDKEGKVLETLIKKCPETMSVEEFRKRHPEERY